MEKGCREIGSLFEMFYPGAALPLLSLGHRKLNKSTLDEI